MSLREFSGAGLPDSVSRLGPGYAENFRSVCYLYTSTAWQTQA